MDSPLQKQWNTYSLSSQQFLLSLQHSRLLSAISRVIIIPPWVSHVFESRQKKKNKSFHSPTALTCSWTSWVFILLPGSAHFLPQSQQTVCWMLSFSPQVAKCLPCWGHAVSNWSADWSPNPVIYNLWSNTPSNNTRNTMLHSLPPPNTHPCAKGNNPSLQEVPPKLLILLSFLVPGVFSRKATTWNC